MFCVGVAGCASASGCTPQHVLDSLANMTRVLYNFAPHIEVTLALWIRSLSSQAAITTKLGFQLTPFDQYGAKSDTTWGTLRGRAW
jgi:hypothetical protein